MTAECDRSRRLLQQTLEAVKVHLVDNVAQVRRPNGAIGIKFVVPIEDISDGKL